MTGSKATEETLLPEAVHAPGNWLRMGLFPLLLVVCAFFCTFRPISDPDTWFHMAFGRYLCNQHALPGNDPFTATASGKEWISSGWAPSLALYALYEKSGLGSAGPLLLTFGVVASAYLLVYFAALGRGGGRGSIALVLLLGMLASYPRFAPRPDLFSQLFVAAVIVLLVCAEEARRRGERAFARWLWLLPVLMLVWANLHVGFLAGFLPVGVYGAWQGVCWLRTRARAHLHAALACGLCFVTWMANPYAARITQLVGRNQALDQWRHNFEWMPFIYFPQWDFSWRAFQSCNMAWHLLGATALLLALCAWVTCKRRRQIAWWQYAVGAAFLLSGLSQRRQMGLATLALPALLVAHFDVLDAWFARRRRLLVPAVVGLSLLVCLMRVGGALNTPAGWPTAGVESTTMPVAVTDFLKDNPAPANTLATYHYGGYMLYQLGTQPRLYMDGRLDLFDPEIWNDYWALFEGRVGPEEFAARHQIQTFVLEARDSFHLRRHLANRLSALADWKLIYFDDNACVFVKQTPVTADYLRGRAFEHVSPYAPERLDAALAVPERRAALLSELERAVRVSRGSANAHALFAAVQMQLGNAQEARRHLSEAQKRDPSIALSGIP